VDLTAPTILPFGVVNALMYSGAFNEEELKIATGTLADLQTNLHSFDEVADSAIKIAVRRGLRSASFGGLDRSDSQLQLIYALYAAYPGPWKG